MDREEDGRISLFSEKQEKILENRACCNFLSFSKRGSFSKS